MEVDLGLSCSSLFAVEPWVFLTHLKSRMLRNEYLTSSQTPRGVESKQQQDEKKLNFVFSENTQNLVLKNLKCERRGTERMRGRKSCTSRGQWWHKQRTWGECSHPWENHGGTKEKEEIASKEKRETVWGQCDRGRSGWTQHLQQSYFLKGIKQIFYPLHISRSERGRWTGRKSHKRSRKQSL